MAHLSLFHQEFVQRRGSLSAQDYTELVAICQFLPGPTSSQVGFGIGLRLGGGWGGVLAWLAFTAPTAILLALFATLWASQHRLWSVLSMPLGLAATAVVLQAAWAMWRQFCPTAFTRISALLMLGFSLGVSTTWSTPVGLMVLGLVWSTLPFSHRSLVTTPSTTALTPSSKRRSPILAWGAIVLFIGLAMMLPWFASWHPLAQLAASFYQAGYLVFGGGHVVLPLLQDALLMHDILPESVFLAGYGVTQAMPGPIFGIASFVGMAAYDYHYHAVGALVALVAIFLPSFLLLLAVLPVWQRIRGNQTVQRALIGINAAVVGLLLAALIDPIAVHQLRHPVEILAVLGGFFALQRGLPAWLLVGGYALSGLVLSGWLHLF